MSLKSLQPTELTDPSYSLWLMSQGNESVYYSSIITRLAAEYKTPLFDPHITLIGDIKDDEQNVLKKVEKLIKVSPHFNAHFSGVGMENLYFKAFFLEAQKEDPLMKLNTAARKAFNLQETPPFQPHLSLLYGDFDENVKQKMAENLGSLMSKHFSADVIRVMRSRGPIDTWEEVADFPF